MIQTMDAAFIKNIIKSLIPDKILLHRLPKRYSNSILLTFDDGPEPGITERILSRLKTYNARAVFFVVGNKVEKNPHLVKAIQDGGHLIGLHTYNHPNRIIRSVREYRYEMEQCQTVITRITGTSSRLARPPLGLSPACLLASVSMGLLTVMWSIESGEWGVHRGQNADDMGSRLIRELKSGDIVLMHDDYAKILQVLDLVLPNLVSRRIALDGFSGI